MEKSAESHEDQPHHDFYQAILLRITICLLLEFFEISFLCHDVSPYINVKGFVVYKTLHCKVICNRQYPASESVPPQKLIVQFFDKSRYFMMKRITSQHSQHNHKQTPIPDLTPNLDAPAMPLDDSLAYRTDPQVRIGF